VLRQRGRATAKRVQLVALAALSNGVEAILLNISSALHASKHSAIDWIHGDHPN
jgi:hypothetical protein